MRQNVVSFTKKYKKNSVEGAQTLRPSGEGDTPPPPPPLRRLRHLNPSHSKLLGTPLIQCNCIGQTINIHVLHSVYVHVTLLGVRMYNTINKLTADDYDYDDDRRR